jgi:hypothetical protein
VVFKVTDVREVPLLSYRVGFAFLALALTASACGSSGGAAAGGGDTTPPGQVTLPVVSSSSSNAPVTSSTAAANGPSVEQPCSFITADEMSQLLGETATVQDDGFRCKYLVGDGWLEVELMEFASASAASIWDYDKAHGTSVPGVGDEAYIFGAAIVVKLGDVFIDVNGDELPQPPDDATLQAIAQRIIGQIP